MSYLKAWGSEKGMGSSKTIIRAENLFLFQNSIFPWSFALDLAQSLSSAEFHIKKGMRRLYLRILIYHHNFLSSVSQGAMIIRYFNFLTWKGQSEPRSVINIFSVMLTVQQHD